MIDNKEIVILASDKGRGGGSVTPSSVATAIGNMTSDQAAQALSDLGGAGWLPVNVTASGGTLVADKTVSETLAAINAGDIVTISIPSGSGGTIEAIGTQADGGITAAFVIPLVGGMIYIGAVWLHQENGSDVVELRGYTAAKEPAIVTVSGTTPDITPVPGNVYECDELTRLTISNPPAFGRYAIVFYSGATPTTTVGIQNFTAEANKRYRIQVEDNYATYDSWPYTPE